MDKAKKNSITIRVQVFFGELKRRKVFQVTSVYLVAAWGLSAGAADIFEVLGFPSWAPRFFVVTLFSMLPIVIAVAWVFELNKGGIQRDAGPKTKAPATQTTVPAFRPDTPALTATWLGQKHRFTDDFVVGRDDACALQIIEPMISRQHARFEYTDGNWRIKDLGSANGIVVDGTNVDEAVLGNGTCVQFYPGGPRLSIAIGHAVSADTQIA